MKMVRLPVSEGHPGKWFWPDKIVEITTLESSGYAYLLYDQGPKEGLAPYFVLLPVENVVAAVNEARNAGSPKDEEGTADDRRSGP